MFYFIYYQTAIGIAQSV